MTDMRERVLIAAVLVILVNLTFAHAQDKCKEAKSLYNLALKTRDTDKAMGLYRKAISLGCTDPKLLGYSHNNLGDILEKRKDLDGALKEYREAERYIPEHTTVVENIARVLEELGRQEEAKVYYDKLYALKKNTSTKGIVDVLSLRETLRSIKVVPVDPSFKPKTKIPPSPSTESPVNVTAAVSTSRPDAVHSSDAVNTLPISVSPADSSSKLNITLPTKILYFDFDSSYLRASSIAQLNKLLKAFKDPEIMDHRFLLAGHTCSLGTEEYNMGLSIRRAMSVKEWLVAHGIAPERLIVRGFGETRPIMSNRWEETRRFNRRVEVKTVGIRLASTRGINSPQIANARELLQKGQELIAAGKCCEAVEPFRRALEVFSLANYTHGIQVAKKNLALAYLCMGDAKRVRKLGIHVQ